MSVLLRGVLIYGEAPETDVLIDDGQIVEIVQHVAFNTWTNLLNELARTEIDFPQVPLDQAA
nr:hypothetical protein [uncultured Rhodococcus sp.]